MFGTEFCFSNIVIEYSSLGNIYIFSGLVDHRLEMKFTYCQALIPLPLAATLLPDEIDRSNLDV